ncbi:MAG: hypothetical protein QGH94_17765 [Phycisphaerae bacterium]|jgi:hypothetical protein|nr:hypothetical protein [Phycisphaerae bacterium]MDP7289834.1 hypothetical protein [Phycisphaerae bacterium]|tara:strand:+ start:333 stop:578 length:246 start_codon:yes stop_codon:yes gene_type:complete
MIRTCEFELELIEFNKAVEANDLKKAKASADRLRDIWLDRYEREIEHKLILGDPHKITDPLVDAAERKKVDALISAVANSK